MPLSGSVGIWRSLNFFGPVVVNGSVRIECRGIRMQVPIWESSDLEMVVWDTGSPRRGGPTTTMFKFHVIPTVEHRSYFLGRTPCSALYIFCYPVGGVWWPVYIGKATSLRGRLLRHERAKDAIDAGATHIHLCRFECAYLMWRYEVAMLKRHNPVLNNHHSDPEKWGLLRGPRASARAIGEARNTRLRRGAAVIA